MAYIVNGVEVDANGKPLNAPADAPAGDLAALAQERDGWKARAEAAEGQQGIPADALDRLKKVDGIGEKLAQKALDALTAQEG